MEYFGTSTTDHGHYRWILTETEMKKTWTKFDDLPFHPENLTNNLPKGETTFFQGGGFTVIAIAGSCKDERPGTKSVFWVKEIIGKSFLIQRIMESAPAMKIIRAIPFEIKWFPIAE